MIETLAFIFIGIALGVFTGLFPGIHLNTVSALLVFWAPQLSLNGVLLIVAMNVTHVFCDWIPSVLLGVPGEENALIALPGHRLFLNGQGLYAIELGITGSLIGFGVGIFLTPLYAIFASQTQSFLIRIIPLVLSASLLLIVASEKTISKKFLSALVIALSGSLGFLGLRFFENQLFALVTGFFGVSTLLFSLFFSSHAMPKQKTECTFPIQNPWKTGIIGAVAGSLVSLFPALSSSQASLVAEQVQGRFSNAGFLLVTGAITASATLFSFVAIVSLGKARTGSAVAIQQLSGLSANELPLLLCAVLFSAGIGAFIAIKLAKRLVNILPLLNYSRLNQGVLILLFGLAFLFGGFIGVFILATAAAIGFFCHASGIKKSACMAFLLVPTIAFYLGF